MVSADADLDFPTTEFEDEAKPETLFMLEDLIDLVCCRCLAELLFIESRFLECSSMPKDCACCW